MTANNLIQFPAALKTFKAISWNGKRGDFTSVPFRKASINPDSEKFIECNSSEMKNATCIRKENEIEVWGWL